MSIRRAPISAFCAGAVPLLLGLAAARPAEAPRVVAAWPSGPLEVRVAFASPVDPGVAEAQVGGEIPFASSSDPGASRGTLRIAGASLADDGRTLVLATDPHPFAARYALNLRDLRAPGGPPARVDRPYDLSGVEAEFAPDDGDKLGPLWLPTLDLDIARERTVGSASHEAFFKKLGAPGLLTLRTLVATPKGATALTLRSTAPIRDPVFRGRGPEAVESKDGQTIATFPITPSDSPGELALDLRTGQGQGPPALLATLKGAALREDAYSLPWSPAPQATAAEPRAVPRELLGGDAKRGEAVFFSENAKCSACHQMRGKGGKVGPDLSEVFKKGAATVHRDVLEPSAVIAPDYIPYTVSTKDGRVLAGIVRADGADAIAVTDTEAKATRVLRAEIDDIRPSATSIMPVGLPGAIGEAGMRDLLAYLTAGGKGRD